MPRSPEPGRQRPAYPNIPRPQAPPEAPAAGTPTFPGTSTPSSTSSRHPNIPRPQAPQATPAEGTHHPAPGAVPSRCRKETGCRPRRGVSEAAAGVCSCGGPAASPQEGRVDLPAAEARSPRPLRGVCASGPQQERRLAEITWSQSYHDSKNPISGPTHKKRKIKGCYPYWQQTPPSSLGWGCPAPGSLGRARGRHLA